MIHGNKGTEPQILDLIQNLVFPLKCNQIWLQCFQTFTG